MNRADYNKTHRGRINGVLIKPWLYKKFLPRKTFFSPAVIQFEFMRDHKIPTPKGYKSDEIMGSIKRKLGCACRNAKNEGDLEKYSHATWKVIKRKGFKQIVFLIRQRRNSHVFK